MRARLGFASAVIGLGAVCFATSAGAQALQDDFWVQFSGYRPNIDTDIQVSSVNNPTIGTQIDLEEDLDLGDRKTLPAFFAGARVGSGIVLGAEYYSLSRESTVGIDREIVIEDVTYPVGASLTSGFDTDIYRFTVGWAFVRNPNLELGAAIGLHATDISLTVSGEGRIGNTGLSVQQRQQELLAPLPTIGAFFSWEPVPRLTVGARIDWLSLSIGDYDGRLINTQATLSYRFTRNFGVGIMYRYVDYRVDAEKERYNARFTYQFSGPALFLEIGF